MDGSSSLVTRRSILGPTLGVYLIERGHDGMEIQTQTCKEEDTWRTVERERDRPFGPEIGGRHMRGHLENT